MQIVTRVSIDRFVQPCVTLGVKNHNAKIAVRLSLTKTFCAVTVGVTDDFSRVGDDDINQGVRKFECPNAIVVFRHFVGRTTTAVPVARVDPESKDLRVRLVRRRINDGFVIVPNGGRTGLDYFRASPAPIPANADYRKGCDNQEDSRCTHSIFPSKDHAELTHAILPPLYASYRCNTASAAMPFLEPCDSMTACTSPWQFRSPKTHRQNELAAKGRPASKPRVVARRQALHHLHQSDSPRCCRPRSFRQAVCIGVVPADHQMDPVEQSKGISAPIHLAFRAIDHAPRSMRRVQARPQEVASMPARGGTSVRTRCR